MPEVLRRSGHGGGYISEIFQVIETEVVVTGTYTFGKVYQAAHLKWSILLCQLYLNRVKKKKKLIPIHKVWTPQGIKDISFLSTEYLSEIVYETENQKLNFPFTFINTCESGWSCCMSNNYEDCSNQAKFTTTLIRHLFELYNCYCSPQ